jgi:hypothetical protein
MSYTRSTIRQKSGICSMCTDNKEKPLTKGMCNNHYWQAIKMKSVAKLEEKELSKDEDLATLVADLDIVFSRYIRLKDADLYGNVECYCCGKKENWKMVDASHFIPRSHMYTRFSEDNVKPCCTKCNRLKDGNLGAFAKHLETDHPGSVEILQEQGSQIYKYSRQELKSMISEYTLKLKQLK